jgi:hypothetical protein
MCQKCNNKVSAWVGKQLVQKPCGSRDENNDTLLCEPCEDALFTDLMHGAPEVPLYAHL